jgi:RHS repeat-associated protein
MKKLLNIFGGVLLAGFTHAQTTAENYIQTKTYLEPVTTSSSSAKQIQTVEYFDGLGRPKQVVNVKATPTGNDIVTPILYDSYGLQTKTYLPIPKNTTTNGNIYPQDPSSVNSPVDDVTNFYQGDKTYSESILEISALKRIQQQKQVGNAWSSKPVNYKYETNTSADAVKKYDVVTTWDPNNKVFVNTTPSVQDYQANILYKFSIKDEDGNETISFKNKLGQIVLTRKIISSTEKADTYYIYNLYNQLVYVIPPLASISPSLDTTTLGKLCYQYVYDSQNRLVEKKLPGKGWEYMVYDKQNRLVLTQDAKLGTNKEWLFSTYDKFGRPAYTGIHVSLENYNSAGRVAEQNNVDAKGSNNTERTMLFLPVSGLNLNYTVAASYPSSFTTLLTVNYYDTYPVDSPPATNTFSQSLLTDNLSNTLSTNGLLLASYVKNIEDDEWTKTHSWYDTRGRHTSTKNLYASGGYTSIDNNLDYSGAVLQSKTFHKKSVNDPEKIITETFEYDNQFRLLKHWHQISGLPQELLSENTYNSLSQITQKKVGGTLGNPLQNIDYQYNIRGWLTKINDPQNLNGKLFSYEIKYQNPVNTSATPKYNGNISEVDWKTSNSGILKRYYYQYDGLDRLKDAIYEEPSTTVPPTNSYGESLTYDINGNIKTLKRFSAAGTTPLMIDDLDYSIYDGNKLITVSDLKNNSIGYPSGGNPIDYDANGNMTSHLDKGITNINYNFLDLPSSVLFNSSSASLNFKYRANGTKTQQVYTYLNPRSGALISTDTDYLDGFQYVLSALQFYPTSEGYYDFQYNRYVYQYKDQVGNIRISYYKGLNGTATIDKETNYYPFGMEYFGANGTYPLNRNYTYGFQEQEKQEQTGWNTFRWRNYDPTMGRFFNIDPLSENYSYQSHYNFSENRVVDGIELEGLERLDINGDFMSYEDAFDFARNTGGTVRLRDNEIPEVWGEIEEVVLKGNSIAGNASSGRSSDSDADMTPFGGELNPMAPPREAPLSEVSILSVPYMILNAAIATVLSEATGIDEGETYEAVEDAMLIYNITRLKGSLQPSSTTIGVPSYGIRRSSSSGANIIGSKNSGGWKPGDGLRTRINVNELDKTITQDWRKILKGRGTPQLDDLGRQKTVRDNIEWEGALEWKIRDVKGTTLNGSRIVQHPDGKWGIVINHNYENIINLPTSSAVK